MSLAAVEATPHTNRGVTVCIFFNNNMGSGSEVISSLESAEKVFDFVSLHSGSMTRREGTRGRVLSGIVVSGGVVHALHLHIYIHNPVTSSD